jgi:recombination protein RecR
MKYPSKSLEEAVSAISTLPGIGKKTALRLALHLIYDDKGKANILGRVLTTLQDNIKHCKTCHAICDDVICDICTTPFRMNGTICVVENIRDLMAIEDTASFNGRYHVLNGLISPIDGVGPNDINIDTLLSRIEAEQITELIMAISPTIEGETTTYYLSKKVAHHHVKITTLARGISFGGELEYADEVTLSRSLSGRVLYKENI